ncbi:hypothetical protein GE09DRAFT_142112 [Coniochaeta sp. 2T2.1]|nr:hypothetical protein GE09DRAFT_142112 [Coniochaeta sp. 2T2.1]
MVVQKVYVLEDDCNGRIIYQKKPFKDAFRVQKKVNTNMLFRRQSTAVRTLPCPRGDLPARVPDRNMVMCARDTSGMLSGPVDLPTPGARANHTAPTKPVVAQPRASDFQPVRFRLFRPDYTSPKGKTTYLWTCHNCNFGPMDVALYDCCINCNHFRCESCVVVRGIIR